MKICPNCHAENDDTASFCEKCGTPLAGVPVVDEKVVVASVGGAPTTKICRYCGAVNDINNMFCEKCGHVFELETATSVAQNPAPQNSVPPTQTGGGNGNGRGGQLPPTTPPVATPTPQRAAGTPPKPLSGKKKAGIIVAVVVIILAVVGFKFGQNHFSRDNQLDAFIAAVNAGDATKVAQIMHSDDANLTMTTGGVKPFLAYFKENKSELNKLTQNLKNNSTYFGVKFSKKGKNLLIFDKYVADVDSVYGTMTTNIKDATISFEGEKVVTSDSADFSKKFGPILPGLYSVEADGKDSAGKEMKLKTKPVLTAGEDNQLDLAFTMVAIPIESNVDDATVMINGKEVGKLADGATTIGPMLYEKGMKVQLVKKLAEGEIKSEETQISSTDFPAEIVEDNYPLVLDFDIADENDAENGLYDFYDDFADVVATTTSYDPASFASEFYENGQSNEAFTGINDYIASCRARYDKNEYSGVYFEIEVTSVAPTAADTYTINYHVTYHTSYPYSTNKDTRVEGFDYSNVKIKLTADNDDYDWNFKFVDMGDGGVKVSDNHPELK